MKKIFKTILMLCVFILASTSGFADCSTGFACSVSDLEEAAASQNNGNNHLHDIERDYSLQTERSFIQNMHGYFDKRINTETFFNKYNPMIGYNDLFIFNTIL